MKNKLRGSSRCACASTEPRPCAQLDRRCKEMGHCSDTCPQPFLISIHALTLPHRCAHVHTQHTHTRKHAHHTQAQSWKPRSLERPKQKMEHCSDTWPPTLWRAATPHGTRLKRADGTHRKRQKTLHGKNTHTQCTRGEGILSAPNKRWQPAYTHVPQRP